MDTSDILIGLAAAAGAVYWIERSKDADGDDAAAQEKATRAAHEAAQAQQLVAEAHRRAAEASRRAADEEQKRLDAIKRQADAIDDELRATDRSIVALADKPVSAPSQVDPAPSKSTPSTASNPAPVSAPSQVDPTPSKPTKRNGDDRHRFDPIFAAYGGGIPVEYLRALAIRESDLDPELRSGPAWGLVQVIEVVRDDYNRRHGTSYDRADLLDPRTNVAIAAETLRTIATSYARNHPDIANLRTDWDNPRFVELLTFGWNAGFSERGGVGRVARYLETLAITDISLDLVHHNAIAAGASRELARSDKVRWSKSVVALYLAERARARAADVAAVAA